MSAIGIGEINIQCGKGRRIRLKNILYIPSDNVHLISVGWLANSGLTTEFNAHQCRNTHGSKTIVQGFRHGTGLYNLSESITMEYANIMRVAPSLETWHRRLGHVNYDAIIKMTKEHLVTGMPTSLNHFPKVCKHCIVSKQTRAPVPKTREGRKAEGLLDKVFSDITGPEYVKTPHGELYTLNFIDDHSLKAWHTYSKRKTMPCITSRVGSS